MADKDAIYKCELCGNVVEVIEGHDGELVCCGKPMVKQEEKAQENEGMEKHVPIMEVDGTEVKVRIGSIDHPMDEAHHIELVELLKDGIVVDSMRLFPGQKPVANFCVQSAEGLTARIYCNIHGLWKS